MEGSTRRRLSGTLAAVALAATCIGGIARASVGPAEQTGVFALLGGTPRIVSKFWADAGPGLGATLKFRQYKLGGAAPILDYDVDMQHVMHVVVIRDDFATFAHLHPDFDTTTGTFSAKFTKTANHKFYVYADSEPHGIGQQVFRFTIESDGPLANAAPSLAASAPAVAAGPYVVTLERTTIPANAPITLKIAITRTGVPRRSSARTSAPRLTRYSLASRRCSTCISIRWSAHAADDMTDMAMGTPAGPLMEMHVPALPAGAYKLWMQFRGADDKLYAVPFTMRRRSDPAPALLRGDGGEEQQRREQHDRRAARRAHVVRQVQTADRAGRAEERGQRHHRRES